MLVEYNASRTIAILVTTALLLNAMMPTLAHAATYLQGTEVNANTLVRDAYVAVTYYDSKGKQKLAKGWIDAIDDSTFTIRRGGLKSGKTIAYANVVSVIMSDESTVPAKQMNEVNRFLQEMKERETEQAKREAEQEGIQQLKQQLKDKFVTIGQFDFSKKNGYAHIVYTSEGIKKIATGQIIEGHADHIVVRVQESGGWKSKKAIPYTDIDTLVVAQSQRDLEAWRNTKQAIQRLNQKIVTVMSHETIDPSKITIGWYAYVVYKSEEGATRTATGQIVHKDTTRIFVKDRIDRITTYTIAYADINTLVFAELWSDIERYREIGAQYNTKVRFKAPSVAKRRIVGKLVEVVEDTLVIQGGHTFFQVPLSSISNLEVSIGQYRNIGKGLLIGVGLGSATVAVFFRQAEHIDETTPDDSLDALATALGGMVIGGLIFVIFTFSGAMTKSDKWVEVPPQRLNLSVAPTSTKGLRAALTFNF